MIVLGMNKCFMVAEEFWKRQAELINEAVSGPTERKRGVIIGILLVQQE
jgi:hypothetical protein